jgi:membrane-bound lytic murein transglycosylase B
MRGRISSIALAVTAVFGSAQWTASPAAQDPPASVTPPAPAEQDASDDASRPTFTEFLASVHAEALSRGIRHEVVDAALATVEEPLPVVLERDRSQAETVLPLEQYVSRRLTASLVRAARVRLAQQRVLLDKVGAHHGVPPEILVALWGIESNFGRFNGVRPTIAALATLAWDPRRSALFRGELLAALEILDHGDIDVSSMRGSWAGAMGQVQFMPSSYLQFAEDFDGDGRRDIWSSPADVFASMANYLKGHGWTPGQAWGREVRVSADAAARIGESVALNDGGCKARRAMTVALPVAEWQQLGVRLPSGKPLPSGDADAALVSGMSRHFLVYRNYDALLDYNCSHSYAVSVGLLANRIRVSALAKAPSDSAKSSRLEQ